MKTQLLKYIYTLQRPIGYKSVSSETNMEDRNREGMPKKLKAEAQSWETGPHAKESS